MHLVIIQIIAILEGHIKKWRVLHDKWAILAHMAVQRQRFSESWQLSSILPGTQLSRSQKALEKDSVILVREKNLLLGEKMFANFVQCCQYNF